MPTQLINLQHDSEAIFKARPNRFLGIVELEGQDHEVHVHVHDPGRLEELLYPGNQVLLKKADGPNRKTKWDLLAAWKNNQWVLVHSGYHRKITEAILDNQKLCPFGKLVTIQPEVKTGHSRIDFLVTQYNGKKIYVEVKGCTLTIDGIALFPDAPTERGTRHLKLLAELKRTGAGAAVIILIFRYDSKCFAPNIETDPKFAAAFTNALHQGVEVYPIVVEYDGQKISFVKKIPICG